MNDVNTDNDYGDKPEINRAILIKLAYERHEGYISAARIIINLCRREKFDDDVSFENLWHILNLMAYEVEALEKMLENQITEILEGAPYKVCARS